MKSLERTRAYGLTLDSSKVMTYAQEVFWHKKRSGYPEDFSYCLTFAWSIAKSAPFKFCKEDFFGNKDYYIQIYNNSQS